MTRIPLVDLAAQTANIREEIDAAISDVIDSGDFILGNPVEQFERAFAAASGFRHCVGVASGTDALELALRALALEPDNEVIVPALTFAATGLAVLRAGLRPRFVDVDPSSLLMDVEQACAAIVPRTGAIIPVHLYGQLVPLEKLVATGIPVIEDAAHRQGLTHAPGRARGRFAATSFYPGKNLGALGDGGAVLTDDDELCQGIRMLRNYGSDKKYNHPIVGFNSRLDAIQAAVLNVKLPKLPDWNARRQTAAVRYETLLAQESRVKRLCHVNPADPHGRHLYAVRVADRDGVLVRLRNAGIEAGAHYPKALHELGAFAYLNNAPGTFPNAESAANELLSLPLYPEITPEQQEAVVRSLISVLSAK